MIQSVSFCQASSIFARKSSKIVTKCIDNNTHLLEQKVPVFVDFPFYDRTCISETKFSKTRVKPVGHIGKLFEHKVSVFLDFMIERTFPKRNYQKRSFLVTFGYAVPVLFRMNISVFEHFFLIL